MRSGVFVLWLLGLCAVLFPALAVGEAFLVKDSQPQAAIVISDHPPRAVKLAARELQEYIRKITGADCPITNAPAPLYPACVYVGKSRYTDSLKLSDEGLKHGAFQLVSGTNWLALLGADRDFTPLKPYNFSQADAPRMLKEWDALTGEKWVNPYVHVYKMYNKELDIWDCDERGSLNAVYEFLRSLGVRWYMPGELGEVLPKMATVALPQVDKVVRPDFPYRQLGCYTPVFSMDSKEAVLWRLRLGLAPGNELVGFSPMGHGINNVHSRNEVKQAHPEYFALWNGQRATNHIEAGAPCLSSEGLFQANVKYARALFDIYGEPAIGVSPNDGYMYLCQCDLCKGKGTRERGESGFLSDYVWDYINRVARELLKTHPDRKVIGLAYGCFMLPPERIKTLSPNVVVCIARGRAQLCDPDTRRRYDDIRRQWLDKMPSKELYYWGYYLFGDGTPIMLPHIIADDLRALKGLSKGDFIELSRTYTHKNGFMEGMLAPGMNHLNVYVTARYYWDAGQDVDALLEEYYGAFYGPARNEMKAFYEFAERNWMNLNASVTNIDKTFSLLAAARAAAGDTVYGQRIDLVVDYVQPLKALRDKLSEGRKNIPRAQALERKRADITIDGKPDAPFWKDVPVYELKESETGNPPGSKTTFQTAWADNTLCLFIRCEDADMKSINISTREKGDSVIWLGDNIEVLLETPAHSYYQIVVNPAGAVLESDWRKRESPWSSCAEIAVHRDDSSWSVEMRIPTSDAIEGGVDPHQRVEGRKPTPSNPWYFNICRQRIRGKETELSAFSPTGQRFFHVPSKFGQLVAK